MSAPRAAGVAATVEWSEKLRSVVGARARELSWDRAAQRIEAVWEELA